MTTLKDQLNEALNAANRWRRIATEWRQVAQERQDELVDLRSKLDMGESNAE